MGDTVASRHLRKSYSQMGEDGVIEWYFTGRRDGFYVDVGAHHPYRFSNTALLHDSLGWRGINIDVDSRAIEAFQEHRPNDINICCGVADTSGSLDVTIFEAEGAVNTFDPAFAAHPAWAHLERSSRTVEVRRLGDLLDDHLPNGTKIDYLNIDAERFDLKVLRSNDWYAYRPELISVETNIEDLAATALDPIFKYMSKRDYVLMSHVVGTSFFKRKQH